LQQFLTVVTASVQPIVVVALASSGL
jgi:hypothetical protein